MPKTIAGMDEFDFHICGGDTTYFETDIEYDICFHNYHTKPYLQVEGNHEAFA